MAQPTVQEKLVPHEVLPCHYLPAAEWRDLPEAPRDWKALAGPSVLLLGLSLGSGEVVFWPFVAAKWGFGMFWAAMVGIVTQYFLNMEIERYTLATGETAVTGFARLWKHWSWIFLLCTAIPWMWPGWATGAGTVLSWMVGGNVTLWAVLGLVAVGLALTLGPVVYNTVEKLQYVMVGLILVVMTVATILFFKLDTLGKFVAGAVNFGHLEPGVDMAFLLGAIAYAGAGGAMNLAQSNFIRDKGYGMCRYVGRIVSPITGQEEAIPSTGFFFPQTEENMRKWRAWWKAANVEHLITFLLLGALSIVLISFIAHNTVFGQEVTNDLNFIRMEGEVLAERLGSWMRYAFYLMVFAALFTTELGILDGATRVMTDIIKVNWLRDNEKWNQNKIYFWALWAEIAFGVIILLGGFNQPLVLLTIGAALNGLVMFLYSVLLVFLNNRVLPRALQPSWYRFAALIWSCAFFGFFSMLLISDTWNKLFG